MYVCVNHVPIERVNVKEIKQRQSCILYPFFFNSFVILINGFFGAERGKAIRPLTLKDGKNIPRNKRVPLVWCQFKAKGKPTHRALQHMKQIALRIGNPKKIASQKPLIWNSITTNHIIHINQKKIKYVCLCARTRIPFGYIKFVGLYLSSICEALLVFGPTLAVISKSILGLNHDVIVD